MTAVAAADDADGDGLADGGEVGSANGYVTDPSVTDTDADDASAGEELDAGNGPDGSREPEHLGSPGSVERSVLDGPSSPGTAGPFGAFLFGAVVGGAAVAVARR